MLFKQAFVLSAVLVCGIFCKVCPDEACKIRCEYGLAYDENGCQICQCQPNPCSVILCVKGTTCVVEPNDCDGEPNCPSYKAVCKKVCKPVVCRLHCEFGFQNDSNGCQFCECKPDPCRRAKCSSDEICVADLNSPDGYKCVFPDDLCCQSPTPPSNCSSQFNVCQSCFRDCTTMRCGGETRCCPDYFGCYGCRQAVPCSKLKN